MTAAHEDELPALRQLEKAGQQDKRRSRRHLEARLEVSGSDRMRDCEPHWAFFTFFLANNIAHLGQHFPCVTHIHT